MLRVLIHFFFGEMADALVKRKDRPDLRSILSQFAQPSEQQPSISFLFQQRFPLYISHDAWERDVLPAWITANQQSMTYSLEEVITRQDAFRLFVDFKWTLDASLEPDHASESSMLFAELPSQMPEQSFVEEHVVMHLVHQDLKDDDIRSVFQYMPLSHYAQHQPYSVPNRQFADLRIRYYRMVFPKWTVYEKHAIRIRAWFVKLMKPFPFVTVLPLTFTDKLGCRMFRSLVIGSGVDRCMECKSKKDLFWCEHCRLSQFVLPGGRLHLRSMTPNVTNQQLMQRSLLRSSPAQYDEKATESIVSSFPPTNSLQDGATLELAKQRHEAQLLKQFPMLSRMQLTLMDDADVLTTVNRLLNSAFATDQLPVRLNVYKWYRQHEVCVFLPLQPHQVPEASLFAPLHVTVLVARQSSTQQLQAICKDCSWNKVVSCPLPVWQLLFKDESVLE